MLLHSISDRSNKNHTYLEMNCDFVSLEEINNAAGEEREMNCEGEADCI